MKPARKLKSFMNWYDLIAVLTITNLKRRYKQRYLRAAWAVIHPLFTMVVFTLVFSRLAKLPSEDIAYPLFNFTALVPWTFFAAAVNSSTTCLNSNYNLITRINFPRITIPLASIAAAFVDFIMAFVILVIMFVAYRQPVGLTIFYILPLLLIQLLFIMGVCFVVSLGNVYLRDIQNAMPLVMQGWLLISPVGYSLSIVNEKLRFLYLLNPMAGILDSYRKVVLHSEAPNFYYLGVAVFISIVVFVFGYWFFKRCEKSIVDIISI
jgi:ABC-type polysaccharide/polyol phosphate export permease